MSPSNSKGKVSNDIRHDTLNLRQGYEGLIFLVLLTSWIKIFNEQLNLTHPKGFFHVFAIFSSAFCGRGWEAPLLYQLRTWQPTEL